eukprot:g4874.t1
MAEYFPVGVVNDDNVDSNVVEIELAGAERFSVSALSLPPGTLENKSEERPSRHRLTAFPSHASTKGFANQSCMTRILGVVGWLLIMFFAVGAIISASWFVEFKRTTESSSTTRAQHITCSNSTQIALLENQVGELTTALSNINNSTENVNAQNAKLVLEKMELEKRIAELEKISTAESEDFQWCTESSDRITQLPGLKELNLCSYTGKISVGGSGKMFYWLVEAEKGFENAPVIVWFNGGPLCSSLQGFFDEHGPYFPTANGNKLEINKFSWHNIASMVYVESPLGVGFSEGRAASTGDDEFASQTKEFLEKFFLQHPRLKEKELWLSGESYAGHYVVKLAELMQHEVKGIILGNAVTDDRWPYDGGSEYRRLCRANFVSKKTCDQIENSCKESDNPFGGNGLSYSCREATNKAMHESGKDQGLYSMYDIYADVCHHKRRLIGGGNKDWEDPCIENYLNTYLNRRDVQKIILHGNESVLDVYRNVLIPNGNLKIFLYSGDIDAMVAADGTRAWLQKLEQEGILTEKEKWRPWVVDQQLAGFTVTYNEQVTYATIRGAGHLGKL